MALLGRNPHSYDPKRWQLATTENKKERYMVINPNIAPK